jgi:hypothetical protein
VAIPILWANLPLADACIIFEDITRTSPLEVFGSAGGLEGIDVSVTIDRRAEPNFE